MKKIIIAIDGDSSSGKSTLAKALAKKISFKHINTGSMLAKTRTIKNTLGVDFRACDNYKNGFEAAKQIKIPTLSILASDDKMCPVKEGKKLANLIEGSQIDIIDNCGHMMLLEEADRVLNVLKKFITTNYPANK